jgi:glycosyltransferase involved in cell wall biosynthesis
MKRKYNINDNKLFIFPYAYSDNTKGIKSINKQRKELIKRGEKISILIANRFINRKGYDIVYEAFNEMDKNNLLNEFDITILGTGNEFDKYKSLFSYFKNINMQGWVSKSAYESILNNCDILVHASHFEPFGIPPVDALARGKYLIVTDKVMSVDFLANKNCEGISFYNSNDYKELYDIFKMLIDKKDLIYKSSADNINIVKSHFNYKHYNTVINKVLSN